MRIILTAMAALFSAASAAAPPPPLAPEKQAVYDNFFSALPATFPGDLKALEPLVDQNLKVYEGGRLVQASRAAWFAWLQNLGGNPDGVQRYSMSREEFFFQADDRIMVREFWMPFREGSVYHPEFPHRLVSYQFENGKLVRVDYLADVRQVGAKFGDDR